MSHLISVKCVAKSVMWGSLSLQPKPQITTLVNPDVTLVCMMWSLNVVIKLSDLLSFRHAKCRIAEG